MIPASLPPAPLPKFPILSKAAEERAENQLKSTWTTSISCDSKSERGEENEGGERMMTDDNILNTHKALTNGILWTLLSS